MALPKFIFNDETKKNSHGFFLLNGGGKFERFQEYSPMLDNHDLNRLIGRWDNLHVEGALLVADPVFDDGITLGAERKGQVERGFLRGASWELFEGSVTSVPSNAGAVTLKIYTGDGHLVEDGDVRLHVDNIVKLCAESSPQGRKPNIKPMEKITLSAEAYVALGINQDADATAMSKAIVQLAADIPAKVSLAASVTKIAGNVIPADRQNWTHLRWLKEDPEGLAKIKAENPEVFETIRKKHN